MSEYSQPCTSNASLRNEMNTSGRQCEEDRAGKMALKFNYLSLLDEANEIGKWVLLFLVYFTNV